MKSVFLSFVSFLGFLPSALGQEAWYLEMAPRYAEALVARYQGEDPAAYQEAVTRLPELLKSGKIKEIEKVTAAQSASGGEHFPRNSVTLPEGRVVPTGSFYQPASGSVPVRSFRLVGFTTQVTVMEIRTAGTLSKQWTPSFLLQQGEVCRLLLERDPAAGTDLLKPVGLLSLNAALPVPLKATWFVTGEQKGLLGHADPAAGGSALFAFTDVMEYHEKRQDAARNFGTQLSWRAVAGRRPAFDLSHLIRKEGGKTVCEVYQSRGEIPEGTREGKTDISYREEQVEDGETSFKNEKTAGSAEWIFPQGG